MRLLLVPLSFALAALVTVIPVSSPPAQTGGSGRAFALDDRLIFSSAFE